MTRISVKDAAAFLGVKEDFIRYQMRANKMPIGFAVRSQKRKKRYTYIVYREKLDEFMSDGGMEKWLEKL